MTFAYLNQPASFLGSTIHWRPMLQCSQPRKHFTRWIFQTIPMDFKKLHWKALAVDELTQACFHPDNQMVKCNPRNGKSIKLKTFFLTLGGKKWRRQRYGHHLFLCRQVHGRLFTLPRRCSAKGCERGNNGDQDGKGCGLCQLVPDRVQGFENSFWIQDFWCLLSSRLGSTTSLQQQCQEETLQKSIGVDPWIQCGSYRGSWWIHGQIHLNS